METNMPTNTNNNSHDAFSEHFRKKLEHHTLPVDASAWDAIQKGMLVQKRRRLIPFWWMSAAAVLILFFVVFNYYDTDFKKQTAAHIISEKKIENQNSVEVNQTNPDVKFKEALPVNNVVKHPKLNDHKRALAKNSSLKSTLQTEILENVSASQEIESAKMAALTDSVLNKDLNNVETEILIVQDNTDKVLDQNKNELLTEADIAVPDWENPIEWKETEGWGLLASLGTGGSSTGSPRFLAANNSGLYTGLLRAPHLNTNATILSPSDFDSKKFHAPLSFGLRAAKMLQKGISLESGVVYTYLLTDLESPNYKARLNLHYLGIPLNVRVRLWDAPKWSVYASGGVMLEKGLRSVYVQEQYVGNQIITTTASTNIEGLQWSLSASVGVGYSIFKEVDLFFEPEFSYFFDNDQPLSIRSDSPFAPGLEAGLRFKF